MPEPSPHVAALVLAAGRGRRMGRPKHLVPVAGQPMLLRVVRALTAVPLPDLTVVLRAGDRAAEALLEATPARIARVPEGETGRAASIRAGLLASGEGAEGFLFALADQPFLAPGDFRALLEAFARARSRIVHACYAGERGTPVLFPARFRAALLALQGDEGGRELMARHPDALRGVELEPARGRDVDRPEDLADPRDR